MALSAVLYGLPFPPQSWHVVAWFALVPFLFAVRSCSSRMAVIVAVGFAAWGAYSTAEALPGAISGYYEQPRLLGLAFFAALATLTTSTSMIPFAYCYRQFLKLDVRARPLLVGAAWVAYELVRARLLGNPWAALGYSQLDVGPLVQIADTTSVYGVSFLIAAANAAIVEVLAALLQGTDAAPRRAAASGAAVVLMLVAADLVYGFVRLAEQGAVAEDADLDVVAVQGNIDLGYQWRDEYYGENLEVHLHLTADALRERPAALVVWPENAMTFFIEKEPLYRLAIGAVLYDSSAELIAGGPRSPADAQGGYYNSAILLSPDGEVAGHYDKEQLLPFAEYFPLAHFDMLRRNFGRVREFTHGTDIAPLEASFGDVGVVICNESLFSGIVARRVSQGARLLVNLTNDGWLADPGLSGVAFAMTRLRAIEQRRYLVRASTSGPSAVVDPFGRVFDRTHELSRGISRATVGLSTVRTPYARAGDAFAFVCLLVICAGLVRARRRCP